MVFSHSSLKMLYHLSRRDLNFSCLRLANYWGKVKSCSVPREDWGIKAVNRSCVRKSLLSGGHWINERASQPLVHLCPPATLGLPAANGQTLLRPQTPSPTRGELPKPNVPWLEGGKLKWLILGFTHLLEMWQSCLLGRPSWDTRIRSGGRGRKTQRLLFPPLWRQRAEWLAGGPILSQDDWTI